MVHYDLRVDYPGVVLALEVTIVSQESTGDRTIDSFPPGLWVTDLGGKEILTEVMILTDSFNAKSCLLKFPQPTSPL